MKISLVCIFFCLVGLAYPLQAQNPSLICKWIQWKGEAMELDTLSILPQSIQIAFPKDSIIRFQFDFQTQKLYFSSLPIAEDSILICYQTIPFQLNQKQYKRDIAQIYDTSLRYIEDFFYKQSTFEEKKEEIFDLKGINKTGNITRGVSFGNTQNVFVNSALNLQLDGKLSDEISLTAAISDQNIPYQPEGNTQQIQDFDRVFIKFSHKYGSLIAGDVVFQQKENYFLKFYKNVQGGLLETHYPINSSKDAATTLGVAVAKGKFASITIPALEGVQGPYRLVGPNNELFVIVIANSEKVFIDGKLLTRGFNNDYVIDYNNAEIIFNNQIVITQFTRIRVDFEFAERNYSRTILTASHYQKQKKIDFFINFYREADSPQNPLADISDEDRVVLEQSGDLFGFISGIDTVEFNTTEVLYQKIDSTTANGFFEGVFVFSADPDKAIFRVTFSEVGENKGDYVRLRTTVNGQVYQWVEPINGIKQGNYAPVRILPTPTSKQMLTMGVKQKWNEKEHLFAEIAFSNQDLNRYATSENADNQGQALKVGYHNQGKRINFLKNYEWFGMIDFEWNSRFFQPIDRFRAIEFDRDWSTRTDTSKIADHIFHLQTGLRKESNEISYQLVARRRGVQVNGTQQTLTIRQKLGSFLVQLNGFLLNSRQDSLFSSWERLSADIGYQFKNWIVGYRYNLDKNQIIQTAKDSVVSSAMNFDEQVFYLRSVDSSKIHWGVDYTYRIDNLPVEGKITPYLQSHTFNGRLQSKISASQQLNLLFSYRTIQNQIDTTENELNQANIMGRLDWNASFFQKLIRSDLTFATSTGRELQRDFVFLLVPTGQGTHTWRDDNGDNLQDLNEFYLAINPDERNYIKVFVPTNTYIKAIANNFSYRLQAQMPTHWANKKGLRLWLSKFSNLTSWTINRRFTDEQIGKRLIPFAMISPDFLLSTQEILRSTLFFNRLSLQYGLDVNYILTRQKQLLTNGFEARDRQEIRLNTRNNIGKKFNLRLSGSQIIQNNRSDFLLTRNYDIQTYQIGNELAYQPKPVLRIILIGQMAWKRNITSPSETSENARINQIQLEARWNKANKGNLIANFRYVFIRYVGELNTPVSYELLEALQPGTNFTWSLNWQQKLSNGLQIGINYDGRKSANTSIIHIGRMQITALF